MPRAARVQVNTECLPAHAQLPGAAANPARCQAPGPALDPHRDHRVDYRGQVVSGVDDWDENERALYALGSRQLLDSVDRQVAEWRESWALDTTSTDDMIREHNARMRRIEEDHKAWLARFLSGEEGGHEDVQPAPQGASSGRGPATPATVPAGLPNLDPREAERIEAERIRAMPMSQWAEERQRLIRPGQGMF